MARPDSPSAVRPEPPGESVGSAVRASVALLVLVVVVGGYVWPFLATNLAPVVVPGTAGGSLLTGPNGTVYGSSLLGANVTDPCLFWLRPSMIDYAPFTGAGSEVPFGPTDPNLRNVTAYYAHLYGLTNVTVPIDLFSASESGLDPDLTPEAVLVQVPRVAQNTTLPQGWLTTFVQGHVTPPFLGFLGPPYVNVLQLDMDLLGHLPTSGLPAACAAG